MKIALGVSGGIAAYKAAEIARLLQDRGVRVQVVMTRSAQEFIRPLSFAALTGEKVITDLFSTGGETPNLDSAVEHISVAQSIHALVVVPATADILAKFAHGICDDFLTTLHLATTAPVIVAPAMNVNMWNHAATQQNLQTLRARGVHIVEPGSGYLACGMIGAGRLAANEAIVDAVMQVLEVKPGAAAERDLVGETILVTAGPTREKIDPVRYISNRSSGKMGYAIAEASAQRGARVLLVTGPATAKLPELANLEVTRVESTDEMRSAVLGLLPQATVVIKAAAVGDYHVKAIAEHKIKRGGPLTLELEPNPDILKEIAARKHNQIVIGFAAETQDLLANGRKKLESKSLDAIVINDVSRDGIGFDSDRNAVTILTRDGETVVAETSKCEVAHRILDQISPLRAHRPARA